jgi:putative restriction endonuclease
MGRESEVLVEGIEADLVSRVQGLKVWRRGDERAPHKPLLLLLALGGLGTAPRLRRFADICHPLQILLVDFGPPRASHHPEYPFWRLQQDGLWEVETDGVPEPREGHSDPRKSELVRTNARGGFLKKYFDALRERPQLVELLASTLLDGHFASSLQQEIRAAVGLPENPMRRPRDPRFREIVLSRYAFRCAVCGFKGALGRTPLAIEAAHIKWHSHNGPSSADNGIALCALHHVLFDHGAFTVSGELFVQVSSQWDEETLIGLHGRRLRTPATADAYPSGHYLEWHRSQVFRGPVRS